MMDKFASDAYSQGAVDALESMNIPQHIKVAAAQYMTKEANLRGDILRGARELGRRTKNVFSRGPAAGEMGIASPEALKQLRQDRIVASLLGTGGLTAGGLGVADAMGAFDEEPAPLPQDLMSRIRRGELNKELALGGAGLAALGAGTAYALS